MPLSYLPKIESYVITQVRNASSGLAMAATLFEWAEIACGQGTAGSAATYPSKPVRVTVGVCARRRRHPRALGTGWLAPAGTSAVIDDKLNREISGPIRLPDVQERFARESVVNTRPLRQRLPPSESPSL